ncbi:NAD(P)H-quinone oxidoreductase subunit 3 [Campylobacter sp. faydin G-24]|uniref:NADH-quinone oxidoreductase subunit A n=1 Tax=Campylobacter anatolicus TaxID=2829105 RepID=A0ABS5HG64_9BACT|nr:NAD(P)H-quinone oxidoreductase subunit 3 [Campylobacter anatolicus]MBR8463233.1 NAD(P)H-quinone oxidoreductase subunit 3 [Campylobacter anatolicus]MBR8465453.1 NAD(P)H-quinone oxidoreductase subunit 3 [Campylobacter anatolicus]
MSHSDAISPYFGAFVILLLATFSFSLIVFLSSHIGKKLANRNTERLKLQIYECGPEAVKQPNRINIHYFLYAILFLLFDVEVIFMYPWAVDFKLLGIFGLIEMILFVTLLIIGFIYAWGKGAFEWQGIR